MAKASGKANPAMIKQLHRLLSDTYVLAIKTHVYHWNVTGQSFARLHIFFEDEYKTLIEFADVVAERIRALGPHVDGGMASFLKMTGIKEAGTKPMEAKAMLKDYLQACEQMRDVLLKTEDMADGLDDIVSQDIAVQRLSALEKTMWMIKSQI